MPPPMETKRIYDMASVEYLSHLMGAMGDVMLRCAAAAVLVAWFWFAGAWILGMLRKRGPAFQTLPATLVAGVAMGVSVSLIVWTFCLFAGWSLWVGHLVVAVAGVIGAKQNREHILVRPQLESRAVFVVVTLGALALAIWQHGAVETSTSNGRLYFNDVYRDVASHLHMSALIAESGLPRISTYGLTGESHHPLVHSGYAVITIGASTLGLSLYSALVSLWFVGYALLAWSCLALLTHRTKHALPLIVGSLLPLVWGSFGWCFVDASSPEALREFVARRWPAGVMYHNFPQTWAVAMTAAALVLFDRYARAPERRSILVATICAIVVSGWIKPSLAFLFGPALIIVLLIRRAPLADVGVIVGGMLVGVLGYMLPSFFAELPEARGWAADPTWAGSKRVFWFFVKGGVGGLFVVAFFARDTFRRVITSRSAWVGVTIVAAGGGAMFALLFRESGLKGQPNLFWGSWGAISIFSAFVVAWSAGDREVKSPLALRAIGWVFVIVHGLSGLTYAVCYPTLNVRHVAANIETVFRFAHDHTEPTDRFLVDPTLDEPDTVGVYIARPILRPLVMVSDAGRAEWEQWREFCQHGRAEDFAPVEGRDAVLLAGNRRAASRELRKRGWTRVEGLPGGLELWVKQP